MNTIKTVLFKELKDTFRDRRTLLTAILVPAILFPILFLGYSKLAIVLMDKAGNKELKIITENVSDELKEYLDEDKNFTYSEFTTLEHARDGILNDSIDALIQVSDKFEQEIADHKPSKVKFFFKSTNDLVKDRIGDKIDKYHDELKKDRLEILGITKTSIEPLTVMKVDIAPPSEQIGKVAGGFIPYIFVMFCLLGCMYPALDLVTGEKEKGTMETLLTVPASRFSILIGKILAISLIGFIATLVAVAGLLISVKFIPNIPEDLLNSISNIINIKFVFMLLGMILPLCVFFAGMFSALVIKANTFKEAQSIVTPFTTIVFLPIILALMPGVELNWYTVWVPILNLSLATKEIVAGTLEPIMYIIVVGSLILLAVLSVFYSVSQFSKESMVLK